MNTINNEKKRKDRRKQTAEDFTPSWLANQLLDKVHYYSSNNFTDVKKTYLDPACGNGNILVEVLKRKLQYANPVQAISTIYGCDIQKDNIQECRLRLLKVIVDNDSYDMEEDNYIEVVKQSIKNIVWTPLCKYPNGSIDYLDGKVFWNYYSRRKCKQIFKNSLTKIKSMV